MIRAPWACQSNHTPHDAMMDVVAPDDHVNGRVQLDAGGFRAAQLLGIADVMDVAVLNDGEHRAHAPPQCPSARSDVLHSGGRCDPPTLLL